LPVDGSSIWLDGVIDAVAIWLLAIDLVASSRMLHRVRTQGDIDKSPANTKPK
jgi:hypothetical protein